MSVFRQSAVIFVLGWLTAPINFVTSAISARALGPEGKGVLFLLAGLTAIMTALTNLGATSGAAVLYKKGQHPLGRIVTSTLVVCGGSLVVLVIGYLAFSNAFVRVFLGDIQSAHPQRSWVALALLPVLPAILLTVGEVVLIADGAMRLYAFQKGATALLSLGLTWFLLVVLHWGITGVLCAQLFSNLFGLFVFVFYLQRKKAFRDFGFSVTGMRDLLRIGLQQYGVLLAAQATKRFDAFLVTALLSIRDAGFYSVAVSIQNMVMTIPRAATYPLISRLSENRGDHRATMARACRIQLLVMVVASVALVPIVGPCVRLVFGPSFVSAVPPVYWALVGVPWSGPTVAAAAYFISLGRPRHSLVPAVIGAVVQIGMNLALTPILGVSGSALASSGQLFVVGVAQLIMLKRVEGGTFRSYLVPTLDDLLVLRRAVAGMLPRRKAPGPVDVSQTGV